MENSFHDNHHQPGDKNHGDQAGDHAPKMRAYRRKNPSKTSFYTKIKSWFTMNWVSGSTASQNTLQELKNQNNALVERLEALEDKSWEIRESEEIYRSLSEAFGDVVIHRDHSGAITFSNEPFREYFDSVQNLPDVKEGYQTGSELSLDKMEASPTPLARDMLIETRRGTRWFSWTDLAIRDPNTGQVGWRSVARDITQRKIQENDLKQALDNAKVASEAKSRFLAMVSHEIRTPLNGVIGMAGLLEGTQLSPAQGSYVQAITTSGQTLLSLIEDLLDTARIESGHMTLTNRRTNLARVVEDVAELLAPKAREKSLVLATYIADAVPEEIDVDAGRLRQVLLNIAGNAVKFTGKGGVSLEVDRIEAKDRCQLTFSIQDSGPGLQLGDQAKIFEEFVQTESGATRQFGGAGLGLAISQKIISKMGGEITVESELNKGARFEFTISVDPLDDETSHPRELQQPPQDVSLVLARSPARVALIRSMEKRVRKVIVFDSLVQFFKHSSDADQLHTLLVDEVEFASIKETPDHIKHRFDHPLRIVALGDQSMGEDKRKSFDGWLTWPVRASSLEKILCGTIHPSRHTTLSSPSLAPNQKNLRVLLAEDNPINALLAKTLLAGLGHAVTHVEDGEKAVEEAQLYTFDLIFMDLHMPVMDGISAIKEIKEAYRSADRSRPKIVVLSADGQEKVRQNALDCGADDYLTKPLDLRAVTELLENLPENRIEDIAQTLARA